MPEDWGIEDGSKKKERNTFMKSLNEEEKKYYKKLCKEDKKQWRDEWKLHGILAGRLDRL